MTNNKTYSPKSDDLSRDWWVVDATDLPLGRLASEVAQVIRGKHKATFSPHVDGGDFVIVVNAGKVELTGNKLAAKLYHRYSGYFGGLKSTTAAIVRDTDPERMFTQAVKGMLPKNRLGRAMIKKLKVYGGADHPHAAQQPKPFPSYI